VAAWDGQRSTYQLIGGGVPGKVIPTAEAELFGGVSSWVSDPSIDFATGCALSTPLYQRAESMSLSDSISHEIFVANTIPHHSVTAEPFFQNGVHYLRIRINMEPVRDEQWTLDVDHGYALTSFLQLYSDGSKLENRVVSLIQAAPGIFWPKEAFSDIFQEPGAPKLRLHYLAKSAMANSDQFDRSEFKPRLPLGTHVTDKTTGLSYTVGPTTQELREDLDKSINRIQRQIQLSVQQPSTEP
jgi:hypothetical protein